MSAHGPVPPPDQLTFDLPGLRTTAPRALLSAVAPDPGPDPTPWPRPTPAPAAAEGSTATDARAADTRAVDVKAVDLRAVDQRAADLRAVDSRALDRRVLAQTPELFSLDGPAPSAEPPSSSLESVAEPAPDGVVEPSPRSVPAPTTVGRVWLVWEDDEVLGVYADPAVAETEVETLRRNARRTRTQVSYECLPVPVFDRCRHLRSAVAGGAAGR